MNSPTKIETQVARLSPATLAECADRRQQMAEANPVGVMLQTVITQGVTADNVAAIKDMVGLYERMQDRDAEKQFAAAFVKLQGDMPQITATKAVPGNDGSIRYFFAPFEEIMAKMRPHLLANGFTVSFSQEVDERRVTEICTVTHIGGHSRSNKFSARISAPPKCSEAQADGATATYAKRFAFCNAFNITIDVDNDGRDDARATGGDPITFDQAQFLREQVRDTGSNEAAFLRYAGAARYEEIDASRYSALAAELARKARR